MIKGLGDVAATARSVAATSAAPNRFESQTTDPTTAANAVAANAAGKFDPSIPILLNPKLVYDIDTQKVLIQFRDQTGKIERQFPSEKQIAAYKQAALTKSTSSTSSTGEGSAASDQAIARPVRATANVNDGSLPSPTTPAPAPLKFETAPKAVPVASTPAPAATSRPATTRSSTASSYAFAV